MHVDIVEAIRQKQREYVRSINSTNGDAVDITVDDGKVTVRPRIRPDKDFKPAEIVPKDD